MANTSSGFSKNIMNVTNTSALTNKSYAQQTQNFFPKQNFNTPKSEMKYQKQFGETHHSQL